MFGLHFPVPARRQPVFERGGWSHLRLRWRAVLARGALPAAFAAALGSGLAAGGAAAQTLPDSMAQRAAACTACHGKEGRAASDGFYPRIAGKPAGYLYNQLVNFREGRRRYPLMIYMVDHLSDDYLREIADYFSTLQPPYPAPQPRYGRSGRTGTRPAADAGGRCGEECAGLRGLPRQGTDRRPAFDPGAARLAARLPQRPVRRLEKRRAPCRRSRLHGADRQPAVRRRPERRVLLAGGAADARHQRSRRRLGRQAAAAMRQLPAIRRRR